MTFIEYFKYSDKEPVISFEIFPPKTEKGMTSLENVLRELAELGPDFITVTYGAMGSTRDRTLEIASLIKRRFGIESACHLTCVGASKKELDNILKRIYDSEIKNIVALRGDPPVGSDDFIPPEDGYRHGNELVSHIRNWEMKTLKRRYFGIAVAGYPEKHLEAPDMKTDIANLKRKVDSGADIVITQLFFDNSHYFEFVDKARAASVSVPIIPGLMPILSVRQIKRITSMCGASIPPELKKRLAACEDDDDEARRIGIAQCIEQARGLLDRGVPGIHFYVLNKSEHMKEIMEALPLDQNKATTFASQNPL